MIRLVSTIMEMYTMRRSIKMEGFTMLFLFFPLLFIQGASTTLDAITPGQSVRDGDTVVSSDELFELGFFSPGNPKNRYLGIQYKQVSDRSVTWVANRENPINDRHGVLNFTKEGRLVLFDGRSKVVWSPRIMTAARNPVVLLLEQGNLVVRDGDGDNILWQSFDYPSNTLLAEMKLGKNFETGQERSLSSWKNPEDPAKGQFTLSIDPLGFPQLVLKKGSVIQYRPGSWNGLYFTGTPDLKQVNVFKYVFVLNQREVYYTWDRENSLISKLVMNVSGFLQRFARLKTTDHWTLVYDAPRDQCDYYSFCGAYASCNINKKPAVCACLDGFGPKYPKDWNVSKWSGGCVARTGLACETGNDFRLYKGLKLPDTSNSWYDKSKNLTGCKEMCSRNCSCTAFANSDIREGGSGCLLWFGDLIDMKEYPEAGQDLYVRVALQETGLTQGNTKKVVIITSSVVSIGIVAVGLFLYIRCKKRRNKESIWGKGHIDEEESDEMDLPVFDLTKIAKATDDFSSNNLLGKGGFGSVYKGKLADEQKIAVKRLSDKSRQGLKELKNEVILIAKLQHRNLVKLLGCCIEGDEKLLIYEYLPNGSLDYFIFDQARSKLLEWLRRKHIIGGIARGLLYLHEDSRLRIIHRDLKASNVLLDEDMNPKISDFGLARIFGGDQTEANTNKVVGTHGYMSPEYAVDGLFSIRSDIFSFGVLVLEIVSGKKNRGFHHPGHDHNLLGHAWKLWTENRPLELTDSMLGDSCVPSEVLRCIHLGLLCVQQKPDDRPNMSFVVSMLGNESSLPQPKKPGFFIERNQPEAESSSSVQDAASINETTITVLEPR